MSTGTTVLLLVLVMALGGIGVTTFGGSSQSVASVGDTEVDSNDYLRAIEGQIRNFQQQTGQPLDFATAQAFGLDRVALGQLITSAAIEDETRAIGLSAGDENVWEQVRSIPSFQNVSGEFDRSSYEFALRENGLSIGEFEDDVRSDLAEGLLRRAVGSGLQTSDVFTDTLFDFARETRDITWARLTADDLDAPLADPTDADLAGYHSENPDAFTQPETKAITYAWLTPDMLAPNIEVDDDQLRALYDERLAEYQQPERRLVERLIFTSEAAATDAKARLDAGEVSFEDLVTERGLNLGDIDLGDVADTDLGAASADVFALSEPGIVGPLPSDLGPALFRMNGILAAQETSFEDAREDLQTEAASDRARRIISDLVPQVEDLLAGGADMALLAERTDLEAGQIDWNTDVLEGVAAYAGFRRAAAAAEPGAFAEVIELDDGGIVALTVDEVREPALRPLEDVRDDVIAAWTSKATQDALEAKANTLADRLRNGAEMAGMDLNLVTNRGAMRDGFIEGTPPDFTGTVFDLDENGVAVLSADGDAWLVRLDAITPADHDSPEATALKDAFTRETTQSLSNAVTNAFTQAIVDEAGVDINSAAVNAVHVHMR